MSEEKKTPKKRGNPSFVLKYSKGMADFICDKIEEGMTLKEVCEKYKGQVPDEKTLYRWKKKYPEFKDMLGEAYHTFFFKLIDEMKYLADQELDDNLTPAEKTLELKQRDQKIKANQFLLQKIAPLFVRELEKKSDPMVNFQLPQIQVISYKDVEPPKAIE